MNRLAEQRGPRFCEFLVKRGEGDGAKAEDEEEKHQDQELAGGTRGSGEFVPDEDSPESGDHGGALSDGVRDGRADVGMRLRSDEVGDRAATPDEAAEKSSDVPACRSAPVVRSVDWWLAIERFLHQQPVGWDGGKKNAEREVESDGVGARIEGCKAAGRDNNSSHGVGDQWIKAAHKQAGDQTKDDAAS